MLGSVVSPRKTGDLDDLLGTQASSSSASASHHDQDLEVLCLMNKAFVNIFDGNYKDAIDNFRKVLIIKPQNLVALNNAATS